MVTISQENILGEQPRTSAYFQATVVGPDATLLVAVLKTFDSLCFDRTLEREASLFEFFVTPLETEQFLSVMHAFEQRGVVKDLRKLPNRLLNPDEQL